MQEGFKGNPNMGSIVLNDFCDPNNNVLANLLSGFSDGDKIFIISSIFGGTGAAGFPLLLKTFRQAQQFNTFANPAIIADAPIEPFLHCHILDYKLMETVKSIWLHL